MASLESQSPSSTNTVQINSQSSALIDTLKTTQDTDIDLQSTEKKHMQGSSLSTRCNGIMGVPITFLDKWCPEQFDIVGRADANIANELSPYYISGYKDKGGAPLINGKFVYKRILIKAIRRE